MSELHIRVLGTPARQGSKEYKGKRGGKPIMTEADLNLPQWRKDVITAANIAMLAYHGVWVPLDDACEVSALVLLHRKRTVKREYPSTQGDGDSDKYLRAICDALTLAKVWVDDSRAVDMHIRKRYADDRPTGAVIRVRSIDETLI